MILFYLVTAFFSHILPYRIALFISERIADGAYFTTYRKVRQVVMTNLSCVFPGKPEKELASITLKTFRNFARFMYEFLLLPKVDEENMSRWLTPVGVERVEEALKMGKGAIILTGHLGNWELGAAFLALRGYPLTVVALDHPSEAVANFFTKRRLTHQMKVVPLKDAVKESLGTLKNNGLVAILGDRDYTGTGESTGFFGRETRMPTGPMSLASRTGSPVVPAFAVRKGDRYRIYFEPCLEVDRKNLRGNLSKWLRVLESYIREYPEQWFVFEPIWPEATV